MAIREKAANDTRVRHVDVGDSRLSSIPSEFNLSVIGDRYQLGISGAMRRLFDAAETEFVLFLEEDFAILDEECISEHVMLTSDALHCPATYTRRTATR